MDPEFDFWADILFFFFNSYFLIKLRKNVQKVFKKLLFLNVFTRQMIL